MPHCPLLKKAIKKFMCTVSLFRYNTRHVALKIAYLGCDYQGFAVQEETEKTIEQVLFDSLKKTRLIESRYVFNPCPVE